MSSKVVDPLKVRCQNKQFLRSNLAGILIIWKRKHFLLSFQIHSHSLIELYKLSLNLYGLKKNFPRLCRLFVAASHQTQLDTRSKAQRPIKVGIKGEGRSVTSRDSNPACLCCSSAHLVQCEPDEASSFTNPNVGPGTYACLRLKLDAWSSAVQGGQRRQKCSSPTRR